MENPTDPRDFLEHLRECETCELDSDCFCGDVDDAGIEDDYEKCRRIVLEEEWGIS